MLTDFLEDHVLLAVILLTVTGLGIAVARMRDPLRAVAEVLR